MRSVEKLTLNGVESSDSLTADERFDFAGQTLIAAIEAFRETHTSLSESAAQLDDLSTRYSDLFTGLPALDEDDRARIDAVFDSVPEEGLPLPDLIRRMWASTSETDWGPSFTVRFAQATTQPRREPIFHNAMLISAIALFETHLARVATEYFRSAPAALHKVAKDKEKEFSLRDLLELGGVEEAIEFAIEARVDELMYKSLDGWRAFFNDRLSVDISTMVEWKTLVEIFERRHCIVHHDSRASKRYIRVVGGCDPGQGLASSARYVRESFEALELLAVRVLVAVWMKFTDDEDQVRGWLQQTAFESLKDERWRFARSLYLALREMNPSRPLATSTEVNLLIIAKATIGLDAARDQILAFDVSGLAPEFLFAKHCLLEEKDLAFELLPRLVEDGAVDGEAIATWPLFAPLRDDPRIAEFAETIGGAVRNEAASPQPDPESDA